MQTKNIIQTHANIIRVTSLQKGNVVKIIQEQYSEPQLKYGVVLDLFNDGTKTFVQLLEYTAQYNEIRPEIKLYSGDKDLILFPASVEEVQTYFSDAIEGIKRSIENKKEELKKIETGLEKAIEFTSGELEKKLSLVQFETISN